MMDDLVNTNVCYQHYVALARTFFRCCWRYLYPEKIDVSDRVVPAYLTVADSAGLADLHEYSFQQACSAALMIEGLWTVDDLDWTSFSTPP